MSWDVLASAFFGSLLATGGVAWCTQKWTEGRERRNRRDDLRLDLYLEIVSLVLDNDLALANRTAEGRTPPVELQTKRFGVFHRLKLLGSQAVREAYDAYDDLVFQETAQPMQYRPQDPKEVVGARDRLVDAMANEVQMT